MSKYLSHNFLNLIFGICSDAQQLLANLAVVKMNAKSIQYALVPCLNPLVPMRWCIK